ncbi:MAG: hypothetical protein ACRCVU_14505 [Flavobacterium sp.]
MLKYLSLALNYFINREYLSLVKLYLIAINPAQRVQELWIEALQGLYGEEIDPLVN